MNINVPASLSLSAVAAQSAEFGTSKEDAVASHRSVGVSVSSSRSDDALDTARSSPVRGVDYGGLFTKDVPLAAVDQAKLLEVVDAWKTHQKTMNGDDSAGASTLIELLCRRIPEYLKPVMGGPGKVLEAILSSQEGQALGRSFQNSIDAVPSASSHREVLLSALLLDLGYTADSPRNNLGGYSLHRQENWGYSAAEIVKRFEAKLAHQYGQAQASVIAFLLLSVSAPEFLVSGLPSTLVYGSHQWATFSAAVARMEANQPGSTAAMSYVQIMAHDEIAPVTVDEKRQQQFAHMTAVIDWAIAHNIILEKKDDAYSFAEVERAADAMQLQHTRLANAVTALSRPMPTRQALALAELRRVYGTENERFFDKPLLADTLAGSPGRKAYSLLDIYMSGDLGKHFWVSSSTDFDTVKVNLGLAALKNIKTAFEDAFSEYARGLKDALNTQFKYQLSLLPAEDRRLIEYGKVTTFKLGKPNISAGTLSPDHKIHAYLESGAILFRAALDGKVCHYLYSPAHGRIIKDADPSRPGLLFPGSRLYFSMPRPDSPDGKEPAVTVLWQALGTSWPKKDPVDLAAFSIYPSRSLAGGARGSHPLTAPETFTAPRSGELATVVSTYFTQGFAEAKAEANGTTAQEREKRLSNTTHEFFLGLIPFYSAVQSFINGKPTEGFLFAVLDIFGFLIPGLKGGVQGVKLGLKTGMGSTLNFIKGFGRAGAQAINPLAAVYDVGQGVFKLGRMGFKKLRTLSGHHGSFVPPQLGQNHGIAEGIYRPLGSNTESACITAVEVDSKWYAFDTATHTPYGAPLRGFIPTAPSPIMTQMVSVITDIVTEVAFSAGAIFAEKALVTHYGRTPVHIGGFNPGSVELSNLRPGPALVDPSLLSRLDAASKVITEMDELILMYGPGGVSPVKIKCAEPLEYLDQLESALETIEEHTVDIAQAYGVFCKPYNPRGQADMDYSSLIKRVDAVEKRVDAILKALLLVEERRQEPT